MLLTIVFILLVLWLFSNYAPVNNGRPYFNGGPVASPLVSVLLVILVVWLFLGHGI